MLDNGHPEGPSLDVEESICVNDFMPTPPRAGVHECWLFLVFPEA